MASDSNEPLDILARVDSPAVTAVVLHARVWPAHGSRSHLRGAENPPHSLLMGAGLHADGCGWVGATVRATRRRTIIMMIIVVQYASMAISKPGQSSPYNLKFSGRCFQRPMLRPAWEDPHPFQLPAVRSDARPFPSDPCSPDCGG